MHGGRDRLTASDSTRNSNSKKDGTEGNSGVRKTIWEYIYILSASEDRTNI